MTFHPSYPFLFRPFIRVIYTHIYIYLYQLLPSDLLIAQMEVTFSPLKRSRINKTPKKVTSRERTARVITPWKKNDRLGVEPLTFLAFHPHLYHQLHVGTTFKALFFLRPKKRQKICVEKTGLGWNSYGETNERFVKRLVNSGPRERSRIFHGRKRTKYKECRKYLDSICGSGAVLQRWNIKAIFLEIMLPRQPTTFASGNVQWLVLFNLLFETHTHTIPSMKLGCWHKWFKIQETKNIMDQLKQITHQ